MKTGVKVESQSIQCKFGGRLFTFYQGQLTDADGQVVPLRAKSGQVLGFLLSNSGETVAKDVLAEAVWPGIVATDESIAQCISEIRRAIADKEHNIIETFPKRGYRLNVSYPEESLRHRPITLAAACTAAVFIFAVAALLHFKSQQPSSLEQLPSASIAVLPFVNEADDALEYLSVGLSEELIFQLTKLSGVTVVPTIRSFAFSTSQSYLKGELSEVGARFVITGKLRRIDQHGLALVELVDAHEGTILWTGRYDVESDDLVRLHNDLIVKLLNAMNLELAEQDIQRLKRDKVENAEALDLVIRGRVRANTFTYEDSLAAEKFFRRAITIDPNYARAYAEIAAIYAIRFENNWSFLTTADVDKAIYFGKKSLQLDSDLWLGHYSLGRIYSLVDSVYFTSSEQHLKTAMLLQPDNDDARVYYGVLLIFMGKASEALIVLESVLSSNPNPRFWYYLSYGHALFHLGLNEKAASALESCLQQNPIAPYCLRLQIANFAEMRRFEEAEWAKEELISLGHEATLDAILKTFPHMVEAYKNNVRSALKKVGLK